MPPDDAERCKRIHKALKEASQAAEDVMSSISRVEQIANSRPRLVWTKEQQEKQAANAEEAIAAWQGQVA